MVEGELLGAEAPPTEQARRWTVDVRGLVILAIVLVEVGWVAFIAWVALSFVRGF